jgi:ribosome-associated protein
LRKEWALDTISTARKIVEMLEEHKAENIILMDISDQVDFTDYFIICTGTSERMIGALADVVVREMRSEHQIHARTQGIAEGGWLLIDFSDIIVHIFSQEKRDYYSLEDLYHEAKVLLRLE